MALEWIAGLIYSITYIVETKCPMTKKWVKKQ